MEIVRKHNISRQRHKKNQCEVVESDNLDHLNIQDVTLQLEYIS